MPLLTSSFNVTTETRDRVEDALDVRFPKNPGETTVQQYNRAVRTFVIGMVHRVEQAAADAAAQVPPPGTELFPDG